MTTRAPRRVPGLSPALRAFLPIESGGAILLLAATVLALVWANSPWSAAYENVWSTTASLGIGDAALELDLRHWVNEAAMTIFFLVVGLEITRELTVGEMRDSRSIAAPAFGAVAGMIVPAITYLMFNPAGEAMRGWGIAMSTDTAFVVGVLALLGSRVPDRLRMFLLSLAIVDDICAITVMALFYTDELSLLALGFAAGILLLIACLRWAGVWRLSPYVLAGIALWLAVHESGVHATVAGVLLGLLVPVQPSSYRMRIHAKTRTPQELPSAQARHTTLTMRAAISPNARLQFMLHPWSAFLVVPMFGLANAGIPVNADSLRAAAASPVAIGIAVALVVGKTAGITLGTWIALRSGLGVLPGGLRYSHLVGGAALSGIGFTIALLIANLAFTDIALRAQATIGIIAGSLLAATTGALVLRYLGHWGRLCSPNASEDAAELSRRDQAAHM